MLTHSIACVMKLQQVIEKIEIGRYICVWFYQRVNFCDTAIIGPGPNRWCHKPLRLAAERLLHICPGFARVAEVSEPLRRFAQSILQGAAYDAPSICAHRGLVQNT